MLSALSPLPGQRNKQCPRVHQGLRGAAQACTALGLAGEGRSWPRVSRAQAGMNRGAGLAWKPHRQAGEGSPLQEKGAACGGFVLCIKGRPQPDGVSVSPEPWGMPPSPQDLPRWPWAPVGGGSLCAPHPCPRAGGTEEGGVLGEACVLGFGSGVRSARRAWGAQAWACSLCSPAVSSSPAHLPWPARSAARGPVPTHSLPPECPGLSSAQTRQGPPGPPVLSVCLPSTPGSSPPSWPRLRPH